MENVSTIAKTTSRYGVLIWGAMVASFLITGITSARAEHARDWRVSDVKGNAQKSSDGKAWRSLKRGETVHPGIAIKTGPKARLIMVRPGDSMNVAPSSHFNIPKSGKSSGKKPATHIAQKMGSILFKITTRPDKPFSVKTPYLAAVIKGTTFTVSVDQSNAALHVTEGAVQVSSILSGQSALVRPGQTAAVGSRNGGQMRLIGFKKQAAPTSKAKDKAKADPAKAKAPANKQSQAPKTGGSRKAARSIIKKMVGAKRVNITKVSRGLVNDAGAPKATGRGKSGKLSKRTIRKLGAFKAPKTFTIPTSVTTQARSGISNGNSNNAGGGNGNSASNNSNGGGNGNSNGGGNGNSNGGGNGNSNGNGNGNGNGNK
jgi:hypothetical protein